MIISKIQYCNIKEKIKYSEIAIQQFLKVLMYLVYVLLAITCCIPHAARILQYVRDIYLSNCHLADGLKLQSPWIRNYILSHLC